MPQLAFHFPIPHDYAAEDFIVSPANREAFGWVTQWPNWYDNYGVVIYGPSGCGKTHLSHMWEWQSRAQRVAAQTLDDTFLHEYADSIPCYVIENLEKLQDETALFHLLNIAKEQKGFVLLTSVEAPSQLIFKLPDLRSRLHALPTIDIAAPDDDLLKALLLKQFADRQLRINSDVIDYLLIRMERSFPAAKYLINLLDEKALQQGRNITIPFIKDILDTNIS